MLHVSRPSLTQDLTDLVLTKPISQADRIRAAQFVLDTVVNALAARLELPSSILKEWWKGVAPTDHHAVDPGRESFLIGAFAHTLEVDDLHRASVIHPGCVVIPAAWATARAIGASGTAFLDAVIRGYEAACRIGMAAGRQHYKIWHNTATIGPYGSAMASGLLLGLDRGQMVDALGNAGTQSAGLWEFLDSGAMTKHLHAGRAAEAGWMAASLAARGFTGPPTILEGPRGFFAAACPDAMPARVSENPHAPWQVHNTSIKPWPSCRHTHPPMDAARQLRETLKSRGAQTSDIAAVHVRTYQAGLDVTDRFNPRTDYQAKFSMQHCVAAALTHDSVEFSSFGDAARKDLAPLRARISVVEDPNMTAAYPHDWGGAVTISLRDGTRIDASREAAKGDPEAFLSQDELEAKARDLLRHGAVSHAESWIELLNNIHRAPALPDLKQFLLA